MIKKILFALLLLIGSNAFSQAVINRAGAANTVQDARLSALYNLVIPRYADTTAANVQKGIDSLGAVIFTYDLNVTWQRVKNIFGTKQWERQARFSDIISATGWSKLGDAGTVLGTNFLGTTDNIPFQIRTSNIQSALLNQLNGNTGFGYSTLTAITSGTNNLALGYRTGTNITSGINNIVIGTQIDAVSATGSNTLNIGNTIYGDLSNDFIGIGVTAPAQALHVNGNVRFSGALMPGNDAGISGYALISQGAGTAPIWSLVTGSGTVTNFSSGNLSPLFTTSVATSTSTPALTFTLTDAAGGTVFGRSASTTGAPSYTSTPVLGIAGTTAGTLGFAGNTSGVITIQTQAAAGTYNFNLPTTAGTTGYFLTSAGGAGSPMTWTAAGTGGLGTVTDFSAGTLSPLFTTSVANSTTTPALTFALTNAAGGTVFGRVAGTTGAPAYTSVPVLGIAGTTAGTIGLSGATSGVVTLKTANAAGTWDLTFPTSGGTNGYILTTNGSGITSWTAPGSGGIGTVTSVSSGNFSPLFTVAVNNPTTTPAFVFTASNAAAGTLFGNNTGSAAAAAFTAAPVLGLAGTTAGSIGLSGVTSGLVTVKTADAAGTWTFKFPTSGGTSGYMLTTDGNGTTSWTNPSAGGTVTSFVFTDANGFDGTVTNATTTPTLSLTTTVSNTQVFYSNSGAVAGISGVTSDGTNMTAGSGNLRATRPQITTSLDDVNGNELFIFTATASSVNELTFANAATGNNPRFTASGGDANVGIDFLTKATGVINFIGNSTQAAQIRLFEDTDDGSNYTSFKSPTLTANVNYTLPTDDGDANEILTSNGSGVLSWEVAGAGTVTSFTFTDGSGFDGTVINANTTPTLSLTTQLTTGSIPFIAAAGALSQENTNLFYDATNDRVGIKTNSPAYTLDVNGNVNIPNGSSYIFTSTGHANASAKFFESWINDSTTHVYFTPLTGTNIGTEFGVMPKGTGYASTWKSQIVIYNMDGIADPSNLEYLGIIARGTEYRLYASNTGTGSLRPIALNATSSGQGGTPNLQLATDGNVGIANTSPGELLTLGTAGTTKGVLSFAGNTSGKVIVQPAAAAGSWTLTLPTTDGDNLQVLQTNGSGVTTWATVTSGTVTDFIFTDANGFDGTVTTSTTTPTLSLTTTAADTRLMFSASGAISSSASLVFVAPQLTVGAAGSTTGILALTGATSGTISIKGQAAAGTYNFNLPTTAGTSGYVLTSAGGVGAAMTWTDPSTFGVYTASNGITLASSNFKWGGTLVNNTIINGASSVYDVSFTDIDAFSATAVQVGITGTTTTGIYGNTSLTLQGGSLGAGVVITMDLGSMDIAVDAGAFLFAPTYLQLGATGTTGGILKFAGSTSGIITMQTQAAAGTYNFNLPTTAGTAGQVLTSQAGGATAMTWTTPSTVATSVPISGLTAAIAANSIDNANYRQAWSWNTLNGNVPALHLTSASTTASDNNQTILQVNLSGANANATQDSYGVKIENTHTGTASTNYGLYAYASQGTNNIAAWFARGSVNIGTAGTESGIIKIDGSTSGTITFQPQAVAGTYNMNWPTTAGTAGQVLTSQAGGATAMTWTTPTTGTVTSFAFTDANGFDGTVSTATTTPTLSLTTTVSNTQVVYSNSGAIVGSANLTFDGSLVSVTAAGLGVTQSTTKGLTIINTTAAAAGAQQISPALILEGRGWKTDATAASQSVLFRQYAVPIQGAAEPTGYWRLDAGVNGSYKMVFGIGDEGEIYASGSAGSANQILYSNGSGNSAFWGAAPTGTVTSFAFTDGNGFDGTVSTATTTPTLSLTTTVSTTQVMYSNAGALAGMSGVTSDGTNMTAGSANLRATRPRITTSLDDANGNESFILTATASAVNEITFANAATGGTPKFTASGGDADIGINFFTKGLGIISMGTTGTKVTGFEVQAAGSGIAMIATSGDVSISTATSGDITLAASTDVNITAMGSTVFQLNGATMVTLTSTSATLGTAGATKGVLKFSGNTSGTVTMQPAAAAGTWDFTLPTTDGNSGEVLTTDGLGVTSWAAAGTGSNWALLGNAGTTAGTNFVGTTDNIDLVLKRGGVEAIRVYGADEKVGINTAAPGFQLEVRNDASLNFAVVNAFGSGGSAVIGLFTATDYSTGGVIQYNNASTAGTNPGNIASNLLFNASGAGGISLYSQHASGSINFSVGAASSTADNRLTLTTAGLIPYANDGLILGSTTKQWSDLFLAEGGVINWDNGDATLTQVGNNVTLAGASLVTSAIDGGIAANDDITINGTQHATKTTSYVNMQTGGGNVGIGTAAPTNLLHVYGSVNAGSTMLFENPNAGASAFAGVQITSDGGDSYFYRTSVAYSASVADATVIQDAGGGDIIFFGGGEAMRIKNNGNVLLGGTVNPASATASLSIFNGTAPTGSVTNGIVLYSEDVAASAELKVRDEAGNITTLSPHNFSGIPEGKSENLAWSFYSEKDGEYINVDMLKLARLVEKLTGEKLVYTGKVKNK